MVFLQMEIKLGGGMTHALCKFFLAYAFVLAVWAKALAGENPNPAHWRIGRIHRVRFMRLFV